MELLCVTNCCPGTSRDQAMFMGVCNTQNDADALLGTVSHQNFHFSENQRPTKDKFESLWDSASAEISIKPIGNER
jgi:hypothetical protein